MFFGVSHIVLQVSYLKRAEDLWSGRMGFAVSKRGEDFIDIDTGNVCLRLIQVPRVETTASVRVSVPDVGKAWRALQEAGAVSRYEPIQTPDLEEMACVSDADGHAIILWRTLTEDEWGFVPDIPKQGEWYPEAEQLLKRLLSHVPALFRMLARRKTTRVIELLAAELKSPDPVSA